MIYFVDTIAKRLKHARARKGWTQAQLSVACGLGQSAIGNIESGTRQSLASLIEIAPVLGVTYRWLAHGEGSVDVVESPQAVYSVDNPEFPSVRRVTLALQAGVTGFAVEAEQEDGAPIVFRRDWFDRRGYRPGKLLAVHVCGASMEPGLFDGDTVVINTAQTEPIDGTVFAINYEGEAVIKRMVRDAGQWWLSSDNPDTARYPRKQANGTAIVIGKIVHKQSERI